MRAVPCSTSTSLPSMVSLTIFFSGAGCARDALREVEKDATDDGEAADGVVATLEDEATAL